jgi:hypothetical protein
MDFLASNQLGNRLHGLDADLSGRNGDHRQRRLDERGGGGIGVAGDRQLSGDNDLPRVRFL